MKLFRVFAGVLVLALVSAGLVACATNGSAKDRVVVMVSGVGSISPYTTPNAVCTSGLSAGSTDSYIRDYLVAKGLKVFTAPVMTGNTKVAAATTEAEGGPYASCPEQLTADLTVDSTGDVVTGGQHLAAFITYLKDTMGVQQIDLVAHSLGGIFTRNAIKNLQDAHSSITVMSLTTLGSPWEPVMLVSPPNDPVAACDGSAMCEKISAGLQSIESLRPVVEFFQPASFSAWTTQQVGVLDKIPVTLIAGTYFTKVAGRADKWPNDGYIQYNAATARNISDAVLPIRSCFSEPYTHSLYTSKLVGVKDSAAITWNTQSALIVENAIRTAGTDKQLINRLGCPPPQ